MKILITGATGFIARNFVKNASLNYPNQIQFILYSRRKQLATSIYAKNKDVTVISEISASMPTPDVVLNLAGAPIIKSSFSLQSPKTLRESRVDFTTKLCEDLKKFHKFPSIFISGSAGAIYRHNFFPVNESCEQLGGNFLGNLAFDWERSAWEGSKTTASRVVLLRLANVIGADGGMYGSIKPIFKAGFGATFGNGAQFIPWISIDDTIAAIIFIITHSEIQGPVNIACPTISTQKEFAKALAQSFSKKVFLSIPKFVIKISQGAASSALIDSLLIAPDKLLNTGFRFNDTNLDDLFNKLKKNHH